MLPSNEVGFIQSKIFRVASVTALVHEVMGLAILVLASIYEGLGIISSSFRPSNVRTTFPVYFVTGWLA